MGGAAAAARLALRCNSYSSNSQTIQFSETTPPRREIGFKSQALFY